MAASRPATGDPAGGGAAGRDGGASVRRRIVQACLNETEACAPSRVRNQAAVIQQFAARGGLKTADHKYGAAVLRPEHVTHIADTEAGVRKLVASRVGDRTSVVVRDRIEPGSLRPTGNWMPLTRQASPYRSLLGGRLATSSGHLACPF